MPLLTNNTIQNDLDYLETPLSIALFVITCICCVFWFCSGCIVGILKINN